MHTVFINTSGTTIGGRLDVLGIEREFKKLTLLQCPLSSWLSKEEGFQKCALQIGEMIDTHKEITNSYNLIVYVDLLEFPEYQAVFENGADAMAVNATHEVLCSMIARFVTATLWQELDRLGRVPNDKILLLLEQNRRVDPTRGKNNIDMEDGLFLSMFEKQKVEALLSLFGLPTQEVLGEIVRTSPKDGLEDRLRSACGRPEKSGTGKCQAVLDPHSLYAEQIGLLPVAIAGEGQSVERACEDLYRGVERAYKSDIARHVVLSDFVTDRRSLRTNKEMVTKRNLLVQCFLLHCVETESVYAVPGDAAKAKTVPELTPAQWTDLLEALTRKKADYSRTEAKLSALRDTFAELQMVPPLYEIDNDQFGLDENGYLRQEYVIRTVTAEERKKAKEKAKEEKKKQGKEPEVPSVPLDLDEDREVLEKLNKEYHLWFSEEEFKPFDSTGFSYEREAGKRRTAEAYEQSALKLANHHVNFLNKLQHHVQVVLSNYAGRSMNHAAAILRKRSVSDSVDGDRDALKDYQYTKKPRSDEKNPLESVLKSSKQSYLSVLINYLKFNAGRGVAVTTLHDQVEWFVNRVRQIQKSLKMLFQMLLIVGGVLLFSYIPFLLIQWEVITKGVDTLLIALGFLAAPFALLGVAYTIAVAVQKRKMHKAWLKLLELSNELLAENVQAVRSYDELLAVHIPSLRWAYEYVLDVDFYRECCEVAAAKLAHHRAKLRECSVIVGNILEDLEGDAQSFAHGREFDIDYTVSFCEGRNKKFYSIIDEDILRLMNE